MDLLKDTYNKAESLKGRRLVVVLVAVIIMFLALGITIGYVNNAMLKQDEIDKNTIPPVPEITTTTYEGRISYVNPEFYPGENISYVLTDTAGKDIILLKAKDDKLSIAEGLNVKVHGQESKTKAGQKYLMVKEVIINATD